MGQAMFDQQVVWITGASRGIGAELARAFAAQGARLILSAPASEQAGLAQTLAACQRLNMPGGQYRIETFDLTSTEEVEQAHGRVKASGWSVDVLVHNAGIGRFASLESTTPEDVSAQFQVNALVPLFVTRALLPRLRQGAKVALVSSRMGSIGDNGSGGFYGYRMSKAALNAAGVSLALDLKPRGIAVVILHPGAVRTEMTGGQGALDPSESAAALLQRIDELHVETTGRFLHENGSALPW